MVERASASHGVARTGRNGSDGFVSPGMERLDRSGLDCSGLARSRVAGGAALGTARHRPASSGLAGKERRGRAAIGAVRHGGAAPARWCGAWRRQVTARLGKARHGRRATAWCCNAWPVPDRHGRRAKVCRRSAWTDEVWIGRLGWSSCGKARQRNLRRDGDWPACLPRKRARMGWAWSAGVVRIGIARRGSERPVSLGVVRVEGQCRLGKARQAGSG